MAESWREENRRRLDLIRRKYRVGLDAAEAAELDRLTEQVSDHIYRGSHRLEMVEAARRDLLGRLNDV